MTDGTTLRLTSGHRLRWLGRATAVGFLGLAISLVGAVSQADAQSPESPTVEGPVTDGARGHPWGRAVRSLAPLEEAGYVEEEFFVSGVARARDIDGQPTGETSNYTTRLLVARPDDPAAFSGAVVLEWLNVTAQMDLPIMFGMNRSELLREGHAYVGVSAQAAGVSGGPTSLKAWDPARYAPLLHPGDAYAHDIFSAAIVAATNSPLPLGGLAPSTVIAVGESQSCTLLAQYAEVVQPEHQLVDGFLLHTCNMAVSDAIGRPTILLNSETEISGSMSSSDSPVFPLLADVPGLGIARLSALRGAPPEEDGQWFRVWEVAGGSHYDDRSMDYLLSMLGDNLAAPSDAGMLPFPRQGCDGFPFNRLGIERPTQAALHALHAWVTDDVPAPGFPRVQRLDDGSIRRDEAGLALGGIQLAPMRLPLGVNRGDDCPFIGSYAAFTPAVLQERCPSKEAYLTAFRRALDADVAAGALLAPEAAAYFAEAEAADAWPAGDDPTRPCRIRGQGDVPDEASAADEPAVPAQQPTGGPLPSTGGGAPATVLLLLAAATRLPRTSRRRD